MKEDYRRHILLGILPCQIYLIGLAAILWAWVGAVRGEPAQARRASQMAESKVEPIVIRTPSMHIHYRVDDVDISDLARVELWYARGYEGSWLLYDYDKNLRSPMTFIAPGEGLFRLLVVGVDRWGRRSCRSDKDASWSELNSIPKGVSAHQVVFVDYTPPRLYLLSPRGVVNDYRDRHLRIRWEGFDQNLSLNPVHLYYEQQGSNRWTPIGTGLGARGEFSWLLPDRLEGPIVIKAVMTDQAGNRDVQYSGQVRVTRHFPQQAPQPQLWRDSLMPAQDENSSVKDQVFSVGSPNLGQVDREQALRCFRRGNLHLERLEWAEATIAYQQALEHDPDCFEARINLANTYYEMGQYDQALTHSEICLKQKPGHPKALFNLATVQVALNHHVKALETLDELLAQDRKDWWAWLMHGDVAEQLGRTEMAKASWQQAANGSLMVVKERAKERLRKYQP